MEEYITRAEFERQIAQIREEMKHRQTDEIPAVNVNVASADVLTRLDTLKYELTQELKTVSETWLNTLQEHYEDHKQDIATVQTVQKGHYKFFEEHGRRLDSMVGDISQLTRIQVEHGNLLREILRRLPEKEG